MLKLKKINGKKGQGGGLITPLISGIIGLVILVIIGFVVISTLNDASLLTSGSAEQNATDELISNFTTGISNVSNKLPTVLLIAAVVLILGVLVFLWANFRRMQGVGGGGTEL